MSIKQETKKLITDLTTEASSSFIRGLCHASDGYYADDGSLTLNDSPNIKEVRNLVINYCCFVYEISKSTVIKTIKSIYNTDYLLDTLTTIIQSQIINYKRGHIHHDEFLTLQELEKKVQPKKNKVKISK